ncbi:MAG: hypothetical protein HYT34_02615 [Candidatus Ryanbacteria bacterium]|nr:hypothetical protein [Candidatus Ryanbacteria bacterium]
MKNLLLTIEKSVGTRMFTESWWFQDGRGEVDIIKDPKRGTLRSCVLYPSSILLLFRPEGQPLCSERHANMRGFLEDIVNCGWLSVPRARRQLGSLILWEKRRGNMHIGFYLGNNVVVSTSRLSGVPVRHHWLREADDPKVYRKVEKVFNHVILHR